MNATAVSTRAPREDVYTRVTTKIIAALGQGVRPWIKPWSVIRLAILAHLQAGRGDEGASAQGTAWVNRRVCGSVDPERHG